MCSPMTAGAVAPTVFRMITHGGTSILLVEPLGAGGWLYE